MIKTHEKVTGLKFWQVAKEYKDNHERNQPHFYYEVRGEFAPVETLEQLVEHHKASNLFRLEQWLNDMKLEIKEALNNKDRPASFEALNGYELIFFCKLVTEMNEEKG